MGEAGLHKRKKRGYNKNANKCSRFLEIGENRGDAQMSRAPMERTEEEAELVKRSIILPIVLDVLAHDIRVLQGSRAKMNRLYIRQLHALQDRVSLELYHVRRQLRLAGIKVFSQERAKLGLTAEYLCRGYRHSFTMLWGVVRAEVERELDRLMGGGKQAENA